VAQEGDTRHERGSKFRAQSGTQEVNRKRAVEAAFERRRHRRRFFRDFIANAAACGRRATVVSAESRRGC
jgi:hypothetical protein